jgi:hypothetical protein
VPARRDPARSPLLATIVALAAACAGARPAPPPPPARGADELAPGWTRRAFAVRDHGQLLLALPPGWTAEEGEEGEAALPGIRLGSPDADFTVLLTPLWNPGERDTAEERADTARLFAEISRRKALTGSVEQEIPLEELSGPGVRGFWFAATDRELVGREPGPDEWRHIVQGAAAVGPVILAFTLLDDGPGPQRAQLLELVRTARHAAEGGGEAGELGDLVPVPADRTSPLRVRWPGKSWAVLVDLPGFQLGERSGGAWRSVFVMGLDPATGIAASVSLAPADAARDAADCREAALAAIAAAVPELAEVKRAGAPAGARATYALAREAPEAHDHLFLFRDGLCASVHVSKIGPEAGDGERLETILATVRFAEDL